MADKCKILVINPSAEGIAKLLTKANALHAKNGPFDAVFLLGDVLTKASPELSMLDQLVPPTYFSQGQQALHPAIAASDVPLDVQPNLTYLGDVGTYTLACGLTVGFVSGSLLEASLDDRLVMNRILDRFEARPVDILLSYHWPQPVADEARLSLIDTHPLLSEVVQLTKPRYHFAVGCAGGKFLERSPFEWSDGRVTRFISLGQEGDLTGGKWVYAFTLSLDALLAEAPPRVTANPFTTPRPLAPKREHEEAETVVVKKAKVVTPQDCFFCLANPKLETHMIVSIGTHAYLTIAKGPLTRPSNNTDHPEFDFSGHALIIPIAHVANPRALLVEGDIMETPLMNEILRYQLSLIKMFMPFGMTVVFFEISRGTGVHYHIQAIPIKTELLDTEFEKNLDKQCAFHNRGTSKHPMAPMNYTKHESSNAEEMAAMGEVLNNNDYVLIRVAYSAQAQTNYLFRLPADGQRIDFSFPRRVLANVLRCPKRVQWMNCKQSHGQEAEECARFKAVYSEYDINKGV